VLIAAIRNYFFTCWQWLRKGGELMVHDDVFHPAGMSNQIRELNKILESLKKSNPELLNP
jgi:hypothetical protein